MEKSPFFAAASGRHKVTTCSRRPPFALLVCSGGWSVRHSTIIIVERYDSPLLDGAVESAVRTWPGMAGSTAAHPFGPLMPVRGLPLLPSDLRLLL